MEQMIVNLKKKSIEIAKVKDQNLGSDYDLIRCFLFLIILLFFLFPVLHHKILISFIWQRIWMVESICLHFAC